MTWHSTYLRSNEAVPTQLQTALTSLDYTLYDPFTRLTGTAYAESVKVFVAPAQDGWTRVIGTLPPPVLESLPDFSLTVTLDDGVPRFRALDDGREVDVLDALAAHLREGRTADDLHRALTTPIDAGASTQDDFPLDALPEDVQEMAGQLKQKSINKLFGKLMNKVNRQIGDDDAGAARALISKRTDWTSPGGQRIRRVMACLTIPAGWHTPDFVSLRDAYQLHLRRERNPNAMLYPGDAEAMSAVPDALAYTPVYGGKTP